MLVVDDRNVARAKAVGVLELALQRAPGELHLRARPPRAPRGELERGRAPAPRVARRRRGRRRRPRRLLAGRHQHPLDSRRPADARRRRAAEQLDEPVVAPAAADARLRAEGVAGELEDGAGVVVEAAHQRRVELVARRRRVEQPRTAREVLGVVGLEAVEQARRAAPSPPGSRVVGVEGAQRVEIDPRARPRRRGRPRARAGRRRAPRGRRRASSGSPRLESRRRVPSTPSALRAASASSTIELGVDRRVRRARAPRRRSARTGGSGPPAGARRGRSSRGSRA